MQQDRPTMQNAPKWALWFSLLLPACGPSASGGTMGSELGDSEPSASGGQGAGSVGSGGLTLAETGGQPGAPASGGSSGSSGGGDLLPPQDWVWYYVETEDGAVLTNLTSAGVSYPVQIAAAVHDTAHSSSAAYPWSPDGRLYAEVVDDQVVFYSLGPSMSVVGTFPAAGYTAVYGWVPNYGPLLHQGQSPITKLGVMTPDGTLALLAEGSADKPLHGIDIAPNGDAVVWTAGTVGSGNDEFWQQSFSSPGTLGVASVLSLHGTSPPLGVIWSHHGSWLAYGISAPAGDDTGGIYLWRAGQESAKKVSLPAANYNPYFSFSADDSLFLMQASGETGLGLATVGLGAGGTGTDLGPTQHIVQSAETSPGVWSGYGSYILYQDSVGGVLQAVSPDGTAGAPIPFPGYTYDCQVLWFSPTEFVANGCGASDALEFGVLSGQTLTTVPYAGLAAANLTRSSNEACLLGWDEGGAYVGAIDADAFAPAALPTLGGSLSWVELAPDASNVVWTENSTQQYRMELMDCLPVGAPMVVMQAPSPVSAAAFVSMDQQ